MIISPPLKAIRCVLLRAGEQGRRKDYARKEQEGVTGTRLADARVAQRVQSNKQATRAQTAEQATAGYGRKVKNALDMV